MVSKFNFDVKFTTDRSTVFFNFSKCKVVILLHWFTFLPNDFKNQLECFLIILFEKSSINKIHKFSSCALSCLLKMKHLYPTPPTYMGIFMCFIIHYLGEALIVKAFIWEK